MSEEGWSGLNFTSDSLSGFRDRVKAIQREPRRSRGARMTARERVEYLLDEGSFIEYGIFARPVEESLQAGKLWTKLMTDADSETIRRGAGDGIVGGYGEISGRGVFVVAYDFDVYGGSMGTNNDTKMARIRKAALQYGKPLIYLLEGGGARVQERMGSQAAKGHDRFHDMARLSGWAPIVSAITGPSFAGHANIAGLSDYVPMLETASLGLAGPRLVEAAVGEKVSASELGGPKVHLRHGSVDSVFATDESLLESVSEFIRRMPSNASEHPPRRNPVAPEESLSEKISDIVPSNSFAPYDMQRIIDAIVDGGSWFEMRSGFAQNVITGLAYLGGVPVGVVANNPLVLAGALDRDGSDNFTRFVMLFNAFNERKKKIKKNKRK
jgi:acetyl-CoA carboxylase carboxyltransferase component